MNPVQSESMSKWTTVLFLVAAVLPFVGFIVASTLNPTGWLSDVVVFPYLFPVILLEAMLPGGMELTNLSLFLGVVVIGIIVYAIRQKYKTSSPGFKFGFAISTFTVSLLYTIFMSSIVATAEEHEFVG